MATLIGVHWSKRATAGLCAAVLLCTTAAAVDPEPGIWLEMGILACTRGERAEAERIFRHIEQHYAPPPGIAALIEAHRQEVCPPALRGQVQVGMGYTSNATRGPEVPRFALGSTSPLELILEPHQKRQPDFFLEAQALALARTGAGTLRLDANARHYVAWSRYDEDWLGVSYTLGQRPTVAAVQPQLGLGLAQMWLGGQAYARVGSAEIGLQHTHLGLTLGAQRIDYPDHPAYDATVVHLGLSHSLDRSRWRAALRLNGFADEAHGPRPGGDRFGWQLMGHLALAATDASVLELSLRHEDSRSAQAFLPGLIDHKRQRQLTRVELSWTLPTRARHRWRLGVAHTHSDDTVPYLAYTQSEIGLSWIRPLP